MTDRTWWVVSRREFLERVQSKWFLVGTLLGPILLVGLIVVPVVIAKADAGRPTRMAVVARCDSALAAHIVEVWPSRIPQLRIERVAGDATLDELLRRIREKQIDGFLVLPHDLLAKGRVEYQGVNASNTQLMRGLRTSLYEAVIEARLRQRGIADASSLMTDIELDSRLTTGDGQAVSGVGSFAVGYIVAFILYVSILLYAVSVMRSVLVEKMSRVVEVIVSSIRPTAFMVGKILGVGTVGLVQLAVWAAAAMTLFHWREAVLGLFGVSSAAGALSLPSVDLGGVAVVLGFFILGCFLYAALYAAVGAMCNSEQEAQQAQTPVVMLLVIPMICMQVVTNNPRGDVSALLTQIPFASPILMPMRFLLGGASRLEVAISLTGLIATISVVVWLAARIYRVGILAYGKRPTLRELARWVRQA